ncbi:P-loop containing nucleoside triphosphate hydrolase protein [Rhodotorula sp. JG-1b]|nr:P-loop containing nucleoside triphosphate hydrolase protein [Rhodotorula sp. JG-1b]
MTCDIEQLAQHIYRQSKLGRPGRRFLVGVAGIPGSGKSTLAYPLTDVINRLAESEGRKEPVAICIGGDGWHLSQAQLRSMDDPDHLFARRGAHFTFDGKGYADFVATLDSAAECPFPLFSHREKDPVRDGGLVEAQHQIIILEGLYVFLGEEPWRSAALRLDERIWVETSKSEARERLVNRHLSEGVESTRAGAIRRANESDMLNGDFVVENSLPPTYTFTGTSIQTPRAPSLLDVGVETPQQLPESWQSRRPPTLITA